MNGPKIGMSFLLKALIVSILLLFLTSSAAAVVSSHGDTTLAQSEVELDPVDEVDVDQNEEHEDVLEFDEEIVDLRTRTSKSYKQSDDSIALKSGLTSMHYQGPFGDWMDIDTTIVEADVGAYTYACPTNGLRTYFDWDSPQSRVKGVDKEPILWTGGDMVYTISDGTSMTYPLQSTYAQVEDNTILYPDTYPYTNERYIVREDALKHDYVLNQKPEFLSEDGLYLEYTGTLTLGSNQYPAIGDNVGREGVWTTESIQVLENGKEGGYLIPTPVVYEEAEELDVTPVEHRLAFNGLTYQYSIRVPVTWLSDPAREYPVVVDPTYLYLYTNNNMAGYVYYTGSTYSKVTPAVSASGATLGRSSSGYRYRIWAEWDISSLSTAGEVTYFRARMYSYSYSTTASKYVRSYELSSRPSTSSASVIWNDCDDDTYMGYDYVYGTGYYYWYGSTTSYNAVETQRDTLTWWGQGFYFYYDYSSSYNNYLNYFRSWYTGSSSYEPYLYIRYVVNNYNSIVSGGTVNPGTGTTATTFQYQVTYQDQDNEYPSSRYVYHNYQGTTTYYAASMSYSGTPWPTGMSCYYNRVGSSYTVTATPFKFYFRFYDGLTYYYRTKLGTTTTSTTSTNYFDGPIIKQPPYLTGAKVNPVSGLKTDTFYFNVTVFDADGDAVTKNDVVIDGGAPIAMTYISGAVSTGAKYSYSTTGAVLGGGGHNHHFEFATADGNCRMPTTGNYPRPTVFNNTPPSLLGGKVTPLFGALSTTFDYEVIYMDPNSDNPTAGYPRVIINGGAPIGMNYVSGNAFSGSIYRYTGHSFATTGTHNFRFNATDGMDWAVTGTELHSGPTVNVQTAPTLKPWTPLGVPTPVDPASGSIYENYTFAATYNDNNNDQPSYVHLYVDTNPVPFVMTKMPAEDGIYYNEENYSVKLAGSVFGVGTHEFYFETSDGLAPTIVYNPAGPPAFGSGGRHSFVIYDAGAGGGGGNISKYVNLTDESITPIVGSVAETFTYKITYTSGTKPMRHGTSLEENPKVVIDGTLEYELIPVNPVDIIFLDGKEYYITISGNTIRNTGVANHYYYFTASNGNVMNKSELNFGPNFEPILYDGGVDPIEGKESDSYTFSVWYQDPEGLAPSEALLYVDALAPFTMTLASEPTYTSGALYTYTMTDATGLVDPVRIHTYYFKFTDQIPSPGIPTNGTASLPATGRYQFTVIASELPDLKVGNSDIEVINAGGTQRQYKATIHNIGLGDVPGSKMVQFNLWWKDPDGAGAQNLSFKKLAGTSFTSGKSAMVDFGTVDMGAVPFPLTGVGSYDIYVTIENPNIHKITEVLLSNNKGFINVRLGPDLAITAGDIQPNSVMEDESNFYITVTIRNVGPDVASFSGLYMVDLVVKINDPTFPWSESDLYTYQRNNLVSGSLDKLNPGAAVTIRIPIGDVSTWFGSAKMLTIEVEVNTAGTGPNEIIPWSATGATNNKATSTVVVVKPHHVSSSFAPPVAVVGMSLAFLALIPAVNWYKKRRKSNKDE
jgi:hypothetical protein